MVLLGDVGHVESRLFCLEMVLVSMQDGCTVCAKHTIGLEKSFWMHPMVLLSDEAQVEACFGPLGDIADADRCTVCAKRTIGLEIVLDALGVTPR